MVRPRLQITTSDTTDGFADNTACVKSGAVISRSTQCVKAVFPGETGPVAPYEVSSGNGGKDSGLTGFGIPAQPARQQMQTLCYRRLPGGGIPSSAYIQCLRAGISAALCKVMSSPVRAPVWHDDVLFSE